MSDNQLVKVSDATADLVEYENEEPPPPRPCRKHHGCAPKWRYAPFYGGPSLDSRMGPICRARRRLNLVIFLSCAQFAHDFKSLAGEPRGIEPETNRGALDPTVGCTVDRAGQANLSGRGIGPELRTRPPAVVCRPPLPLLKFYHFGSLGFCWASPSAASWGACCGRDQSRPEY
jgi:hypothetical protein